MAGFVVAMCAASHLISLYNIGEDNKADARTYVAEVGGGYDLFTGSVRDFSERTADRLDLCEVGLQVTGRLFLRMNELPKLATLPTYEVTLDSRRLEGGVGKRGTRARVGGVRVRENVLVTTSHRLPLFTPVRVEKGEQRWYGFVIYKELEYDFAFVWVPFPEGMLPPVEIAKPVSGQTVLVTGYPPEDRDLSFSLELMGGPATTVPKAWYLSGTIVSGFSGSGIYNRRGNLVGIAAKYSRYYANTIWMTPGHRIKTALDRWIPTKKEVR